MRKAKASGRQAGRILSLTFENGEKRVFDIGRLIARGGLFEPLKDYDAFNEFEVLPYGRGLEWGCGADLSRDTLYHDSMYVGTVRRLGE